MRKLATITAAVAALAIQSPATAAMGQCFDAYGRPYGPPHNTDNPPYAMICQAYRIGGHCTQVGAGWAESNCGIGPRYRDQGRYKSAPRGYDYENTWPKREGKWQEEEKRKRDEAKDWEKRKRDEAKDWEKRKRDEAKDWEKRKRDEEKLKHD
jgi:hypothetical protein